MPPVLIGCIVDVSGSMERSVGQTDWVKKRKEKWVRSVINTLEGLVQHDVSPSNHIFAIGFGARCEPNVFDLLKTLDRLEPELSCGIREYIEEILSFLEKNGAANIRNWARVSAWIDAISPSQITHLLKLNSDFMRILIEHLPQQCRVLHEEDPRNRFFPKSLYPPVLHKPTATVDEIQILVRKAFDEHKKGMVADILEILQKSCKPEAYQWAPLDIWLDVLEYREAEILQKDLKADNDLKRKFVNEYLSQCSRKHHDRMLVIYRIDNSQVRTSSTKETNDGAAVKLVRQETSLTVQEIGAHGLHEWIPKHSTTETVLEAVAMENINMLRSDTNYRRNFVNDFLKPKYQNVNYNVSFKFVTDPSKENEKYAILELHQGPLKDHIRAVVKKGLNKTLHKVIEQVLSILEKNGAPRIRKWAKMDDLLDVVRFADASTLLQKIKFSFKFRERFISECLPPECKKLDHKLSSYRHQSKFFLGSVMIPHASKDKIKSVVKEGIALATEPQIARISPSAAMKVNEASNILNTVMKKEGKLEEDRLKHILKQAEPYMFGKSHFFEALNQAKVLFEKSEFRKHEKLLFILSDGKPTDGENSKIDSIIQELANLKVKTVSCYITNYAIPTPCCMYSSEREEWGKATKLMFRLSSTIPTQMIPRSIFVKRGWNIEFTNNETRLFLQLNQPDLIEDVCNFAKNIVCSKDALSDALTSISLDLYINKANGDFKPKVQEGGTCYANASATVVHLATKRIIGRDGGYPDFYDIRKKLIKKYGKKGAKTLDVIRNICPLYRLHSRSVDLNGALKAVANNRPVLARFAITVEEWETFHQFYEKEPCGTLTKSHLNTSIKHRKQRSDCSELQGHAVVLTSYGS